MRNYVWMILGTLGVLSACDVNPVSDSTGADEASWRHAGTDACGVDAATKDSGAASSDAGVASDAAADASTMGSDAGSSTTPDAGSSSPAFVKYTTGVLVSGNSLQVTIKNVAAGHALIVAVRMSNAGTSTVTSPGATWTRDAHAANPVGVQLDIHSAIIPSAGDVTLTITDQTPGDGRAIRAIVSEYSGISSGTRVVASNSNDGLGSTANAGSVTTTTAGCLLFCAASTDSDLLGWSAGSGYTFIDDPNSGSEPDQKLGVEDRGPVNAGTYPCSFTMTSDSWAAGIVAYAPSGNL